MSVRTAAKCMLSFNCLIAFSAVANDDDVFDYVIERAQTLADAPYQPPK